MDPNGIPHIACHAVERESPSALQPRGRGMEGILAMHHHVVQGGMEGSGHSASANSGRSDDEVVWRELEQFFAASATLA